jgi:hypothetical protein
MIGSDESLLCHSLKDQKGFEDIRGDVKRPLVKLYEAT